MGSFASSIMKNIILFSFTFIHGFIFAVKLIFYIVFGSASSGCLLKSFPIILQFYQNNFNLIDK